MFQKQILFIVKANDSDDLNVGRLQVKGQVII